MICIQKCQGVHMQMRVIFALATPSNTKVQEMRILKWAPIELMQILSDKMRVLLGSNPPNEGGSLAMTWVLDFERKPTHANIYFDIPAHVWGAGTEAK